MDLIKKRSIDFQDEYLGVSFEKFESELSSTVYYINKPSEKIRFLSYLRDSISTLYQEHMKVCGDPDDCGHNRDYEAALYSINQNLEIHIDQQGGSYNPQELPAMQFFSDGQYFDAFTAIKESIKVATKSIILVDNYVDENTLAFFPAKDPSIKLRILTTPRSNNQTFTRAVALYDKQFENLKISTSSAFHDRFLILDDNVFYRIGSSIKDAGNKAFMYSKVEEPGVQEVIRQKLLTEWPGVYS